MKSAFIIHGSNGNPDKHWYPWLRTRLEEKGLQVFAPQFPIGDRQYLENWFNILKPLKNNLDNSVLIGHSLGVPFILNVLNQWDNKIKAAFLVSGFVGHLDVEDEPNIEDFSEKTFDWKKIKQNCQHFYVIHSDNDPYVPLEKAEELAKHLGTDVIMVKSGQHFQAESGYRTFELLLEKIRKEL